MLLLCPEGARRGKKRVLVCTNKVCACTWTEFVQKQSLCLYKLRLCTELRFCNQCLHELRSCTNFVQARTLFRLHKLRLCNTEQSLCYLNSVQVQAPVAKTKFLQASTGCKVCAKVVQEHSLYRSVQCTIK